MAAAQEFLDDGTASSPEDAIRMAAATLDGAGDREGATVESIQTCRDLGGQEVRGLTTNDTVKGREDKFARDETDRARAADLGVDDAEAWLKKNDPIYRGKRKGWRA